MYKDTKYKKQRKEVARFMRRLYRMGLTTTSGGNISLRVNDDVIILTPSATDKGMMKWKEVGLMSILGENLTPDLKPSIESELHLKIYKKKSGVKAIVHAHPVFASSFTAMKSEIDTSLTAEARAICGKPMPVPYAVMGSENLAEIVSEHALESDILLLENHGVIATGETLLQAFDKLEVLENAAKMTLIVELKRNKKNLSASKLREIDRIFRRQE